MCEKCYDDPHSSDMKISSEQRPGKIAPNERDTGGLGATDSNTDVSEKSGEKTRENDSGPSESTVRLDDCVPQEHHLHRERLEENRSYYWQGLVTKQSIQV